jgi:hypothetical protein
MSLRLKELQAELAGVRGRLEAHARRLAALRAATVSGDASAAAGEVTPPPEPLRARAPLFGAGGSLDDVELTFEVLDTEDPSRGGG